MELKQYTEQVNTLLRAKCDVLNVMHKAGLSLFGAKHYDYPESMMRLYFDQRLTPEQAVAAIEQDAD